MKQLKRIKGTQDILATESPAWVALEQQVRRTMARYNYAEVRTPVFELTELFARGIGELTDIVSKEMYTFTDRAKKSLTLKPEMTAPIMRAFLENNLQAQAPLQKLFYIAPLFRQENPQAGRLRQFHQYGAELIGSPSPLADAEVIDLSLAILKELGLNGLKLRLNTVGDPESRQKYRTVLQEYLRPRLQGAGEEVLRRLEQNPLRVLDSKDPQLQDTIAAAPRITEYLSEQAAAHYDTVKRILTDNNLEFEEVTTLVRGLDYYTHTVYEITSDALGAQNALVGGGRYDLLAEELSGKAVPAVGFAAGIERILMVAEAQDVKIGESERMQLFVVSIGDGAREKAQVWMHRLREAGFSVDGDLLERSPKAQFREANRQNALFTLVLGEEELARGVCSVKNMDEGAQQEVAFDSLIEHLQKMIQ